MRARTTLAGAALAVLALPVAEPVAEEGLGWTPEEGVTLRRSFSEETSWHLTGMDQVADGSDRELDTPEVSGLTLRALEVVDTIAELGEGRPALLRRTFTEALRTSELDFRFQDLEEFYEFELASPLADETVTFRWDADEQDWRVELEGVGSGPPVLEGLREDLDLRALLPQEAVSEGDSWTVDAELLVDLLRPGGVLGFTRDSPPEGPYSALTATDVVATSLISAADAAGDIWGEAELEWTETREVDGVRLALVAVGVEIELSADVTERIRQLVEESGAHGKRDTELAFDWEVEGEGQLVWNLSAGHFASLDLSLEGPASVDMSWEEGGVSSYHVEMTIGMEIESRLRAEAAPE